MGLSGTPETLARELSVRMQLPVPSMSHTKNWKLKATTVICMAKLPREEGVLPLSKTSISLELSFQIYKMGFSWDIVVRTQ